MQTENSALRGGQVIGGGGAGGLGGGGGGSPAHWQGGVRSGGGGGRGGDHSSLAMSSSPAHRRDRQAFSMYEPGPATPKPHSHSPGLDSLTGRLQPLHPSVSVSNALRPPGCRGHGDIHHLPSLSLLLPTFSTAVWHAHTAHQWSAPLL